ncbi:AmmeMemoRadiSam system radical SAM enzyme [Desulfurivibrio sp. D14AmB]|uniref:AmmeMemoRadiSam system radical SAM enzyme n=1 Tax=Desulfurivibrio sp. D14AmB TaxID=3374370 RepID=UPI00376EC9CD
METARFYRVLDEDKVQCYLCPHHCRITPGKRGICRVRENRAGTLYTLNYGRLISGNIDPIEKKPIFHLLPGSLSYSIATVGCNFRCLHCQNYEISQYPALHNNEIAGILHTPAEVVAAAQAGSCRSISYTYVEPTIFYEFAFDTAQLARKAGVRNIFVSNGYIGPEATREIAPWLDAINIDLKAFSQRFYHEVCGAHLQPVLDTIILMKELGIWVEVTTLIIPGWNDSTEELTEIARFLVAIDPHIPWHVSRFWPTYKMMGPHPTPPETLHRAREIGRASGLHHVYVGNIHDNEGENTTCPNCGTTLITRLGFGVGSNQLIKGHCPQCDTEIAGRW